MGVRLHGAHLATLLCLRAADSLAREPVTWGKRVSDGWVTEVGTRAGCASRRGKVERAYKDMDRWEDGAAGATTAEQINQLNATASETKAGATGAAGSEPIASSDGWTMEIEETPGMSPALRAAIIAGSATLGALAVAGGITWFVLQRRRMSASARMEAAIAASRLLRMTPSIARPDMLEATEAGSNVSEHVQITATEAARLARALGRAASLSGGAARDYATDRVSAAQDALISAYAAARDRADGALQGASGAWQNVAQNVPATSVFQPQWLVRAFNAGRYAGRIEQRMK